MSPPDAEALRAARRAADEEQSSLPIDGTKQPCDTRWVEVRVVNDRGVPLANERVWLLVSLVQDKALELRTNADGIAHWDDVPEAGKYHVQLVDVLESWLPAENGRAPDKDAVPKPGAYQKGDGVTHPVVPCKPGRAQEIIVDRLTEREKLSHFIHAYTDNGGHYHDADPHTFLGDHPRFFWGTGAKCNEHVNFFLGFWNNYADKFTWQARSTCMDALPTATSEKQGLYKKGTDKAGKPIYAGVHRGYREFVEPVTGGDVPYHHVALNVDVEYFRFGKYVDRRTGKIKGGPFERLSDYNVYSICDLSDVDRPARAKRMARWRRAADKWFDDNKGYAPKKKLSDEALLDYVWDMDDADPKVAVLLNNKLFYPTNQDHHCGVLYKRGGELMTFPADGGGKSGPPIVVKDFARAFMSRQMLYLAFWRVKPLRPGGYAAADAEKLQREISVDNVSRMIEWSKGGGGSVKRKPVKNVTRVKKKG